jgi:hypothetical protein
VYGGGPPFGNSTECPGSVVLAWVRNYRKGAPVPPPTPQCIHFPETGHDVCFGFKDYYLAAVPGHTVADAIRHFGYPITGEMQETIGAWSGTVQYFERARLEWHTETGVGHVEEGRVGAELLAARHNSGPGNPPPGATH